jgi:hypothetical protein
MIRDVIHALLVLVVALGFVHVADAVSHNAVSSQICRVIGQ